jgi:hypothetical protein
MKRKFAVKLLAWSLGLASISARGEAPTTMPDAGRQCQLAYQHEDLNYVYAHCPFEAWALARAQCERADETVSPRYTAFCKAFKTGRAPIAGLRP